MKKSVLWIGFYKGSPQDPIPIGGVEIQECSYENITVHIPPNDIIQPFWMDGGKRTEKKFGILINMQNLGSLTHERNE